MNKPLIKRSIPKADISTMPLEAFAGRIITILTEEEAAKAIDYLLTQTIVGVDTETRPSFVSGRRYTVSLLQIATTDTCFLFRLNSIGFPESILHFIENPKITKVGLSLRDDFGALHRRSAFEPSGFIELQEYVSQFGIEDQSLQKIYAILFGKRISKSQRLSNWEADVLTDKQKLYAATDAWACLRIYHHIEELKRTGEYQLEEKTETIETNNKHGLQESVS